MPNAFETDQRPRGVQRHEVWAAADDVLRRGARPTIERVRQAMGRGSPNTVGPMLEAWYASLGGRLEDTAPQPPENHGLPPDVAQAMHGLWHQAQTLARADAEATLQAQRARLEEERQTFEAQRQAVERERELERLRFEQLTQTLERAQQDLVLAMQARSRLEETLSASMAHAESLQARLAEEHQAFHAMATQAAAERARLEERHRGNEHRLLDEIERSRAQHKAAQKLLSEASLRQLEQDRRHVEEVSRLQDRLQIQAAHLEEARSLQRAQASRLHDLEQRLAATEAKQAPSRGGKPLPLKAWRTRRNMKLEPSA